MPNGDLASLVLEAARRERAKDDASDAGRNSQDGKHTRSDVSGSSTVNAAQKNGPNASTSSKSTGNGHLAPPPTGDDGETHAAKSDRTITASPEPLRMHRQDTTTSNGVISEESTTTNPAKKSPAAKGKSGRPIARKLSSTLSPHVRPASRRTSTASRDRRIYTSQSSNDQDDEQAFDRTFAGADTDQGEGSSKKSHDASRLKDIDHGSDQLDSTRHASGPKGESGSSSQLRGPFSRIDSTRGESMLANKREGSSETPDGDEDAGPQSRARRQVMRRRSTGGYDSRRQSMSNVARRFVGFFTDNEVDEEDGADDQRYASAASENEGPSDTDARRGKVQGQSHLAAPSGAASSALSRRSTHSQQPADSSRPTPSRQSSGYFARPLRRRASTGEPDRPRRSLSHGQEQAGETTGDEAGGYSRPAARRGQTEGIRNQARSRWDALRQRLKQEKKPAQLDKGLTGSELITDLSAGMMSVMMLKMAFDRDEHNKHRIPVLLNYLKLRITDSVYPFHNTHAVFRIELEYGDGLLKWVIYRELRDFVNLHTHYRVANVKHSLDNFPPFPKVSIPYFNVLRKETREKGGTEPGRAEFARSQREALENYLLRLVRAVMFRPEANRLCKFLEISALSVHLATRGGTQGKQGYLRILSPGASRHKRPGFHPLDLKRRHEPKWFMVRESYIVSVDEVFDSKIYDVFLMDADFVIERPKRLYRQGIGFFADGKQKTPDEDSRKDADGIPDGGQPFAGMEGIRGGGIGDPNDPSTTSDAKDDPQNLKNASAHTFYIKNAERKVKLVAKSERQMDQFIASIEKMASRSIWCGRNRFGSFAPIRMNVAAQWLVDGRDYYWNLSRAILLAKHSIYIHDWWLSPELYLRRPPAENGRWRLDRLLQKKAEEGVQIYIIVYNEVSNDFTPVDSQYTKSRMVGLHPNIMVQRSPSHAQTRTLLWSHHEKMCVIDETIGFMGGLDLCFGRWDTPGHSMVDDGQAIKDDLDLPHKAGENSAEEYQIWPGKDYANSRVSDFYDLNKPFEDMYDRTKVPREPWHDIGLQILGQPARDLCRHFCQRWNLLLRTKSHKRYMPFLLPPSDFTGKELNKQQLAGTCEVQICRSAGPWSIGTPDKIEHSIQTAYIKAIQLSDYFVYIENQFFISSTVVTGTAVENNIGNALVARIQQAHAAGKPWRAIIVMPLEPGYAMPVDHPDAGSVRLIMECQFNTISRGENSIFARLRRDGIDPNEYISFYGLRSWARMQDGTLATSDIYIHAKTMVVDDRIAIIGSANINERSQRGDRDSELACVIRDTDMIDSTMAGKPYKVGRFAHTLRIRLMREHLGVDVDALEEEEANMDLLTRSPVVSEDEAENEKWDPTKEQGTGQEGITSEKAHRVRAAETAHKAGTLIGEAARGATEAVGIGADKALPNVKEETASNVRNAGSRKSKGTKTAQDDDSMTGDDIVQHGKDGQGFASTVVPTIEEKVLAEGRPPSGAGGDGANPTKAREQRSHSTANKVASDDLEKTEGQPATMESKEANDTRQLSNGAPDGADGGNDHRDDPEDFKQSHKLDTKRDEKRAVEEDIEHGRPGQRHTRYESSATTASLATQGSSSKTVTVDNGGKLLKSNEQAANNNKATDAIRKSLAGRMNPYSLPTRKPKIDAHKFADPLIDTFYKDMWMAAAVRNTQIFRKVFRCTPDDLVTTWSMYKEWSNWQKRHEQPPKPAPSSITLQSTTSMSSTLASPNGTSNNSHPNEGINGDARDGGGEKLHHKSPSDMSHLSSHLPHSNSRKQNNTNNNNGNHQSNKDGGPEAFTEEEIEQMMALLEECTGHLVLFSTRFLEGESMGQNFLWSKDRIPPIAIYN